MTTRFRFASYCAHNLGIKKIRINYCTLDTTFLLSL